MDSGTIELIKKLARFQASPSIGVSSLGTAMEIRMWAISVCEKNKLEVRPAVIWEILKKQEEILAKTEE